MRKIKLLFCLLIIFCVSFTISIIEVDAVTCDKADIERLKELASYVEVSYEYIENNNEDSVAEGEESIGILEAYTVFVYGLNEELYVSDGEKKYYYEDVNSDGAINILAFSGSVEISVYSKNCDGYELNNISVTLPKFNRYYLYDECKELEHLELDICDKWYQGYMDEDTFYSKIRKYLEDDDSTTVNKIVNFLKEYYLFIIGTIVIVIFIVVMFVKNRRRSVLE